jgi:hypothetical protein
VYLLYEDSQPPSSSILEEYQDVEFSEKSKAHSTKTKYFRIGDLYNDSQMKRSCFSFSGPNHVPYLIPPSQGNIEVFLGYPISSRSLGRDNIVNEDEYEPSYTTLVTQEGHVPHFHGKKGLKA